MLGDNQRVPNIRATNNDLHDDAVKALQSNTINETNTAQIKYYHYRCIDHYTLSPQLVVKLVTLRPLSAVPTMQHIPQSHV